MKNSSITLIFKQVFFTAACFTFLSGGTSLWLAGHEKPTSQQVRMFEIFNTTWNMGVGAMFGLLGSKATELVQCDDDKSPKE